jgi:thioredoxin-related protein
MKKWFVIFLINSLFSFSQKTEKLNTYSFEEVEKLQSQNPKSVLVFVYTDWCKICFGMKKTTFKNDKIITLLNTNFYVIYLNAATKNEITFIGKIFRNQSSGVHELASILAMKNKQIAYPTIVILNKKMEIDLQLQGFRNSNQLTTILEKYLQKS